MKWTLAVAGLVLIVGCSNSQQSSSVSAAIAEINARENNFSSYPQPNTTYLSYSGAHGFQVNYLGPNGRAWLWYPRNQRGVPEEYKLETISDQKAICWRHPTNSYNPVTQTQGGNFACQRLDFTQRQIVAALPGDPFSLRDGTVPYALDRCVAPDLFSFDRNKISC